MQVDFGHLAQVPFGGSFHSLVRWCAWAEAGSDTVRLQVSCDVVFTQRWVPAKSIISSSSVEVINVCLRIVLQDLILRYNAWYFSTVNRLQRIRGLHA